MSKSQTSSRTSDHSNETLFRFSSINTRQCLLNIRFTVTIMKCSISMCESRANHVEIDNKKTTNDVTTKTNWSKVHCRITELQKET